MAYYDDTGYGGNNGLSDIANLSQLQSVQAPFYGQQAANLADPFASQRGQYQKQLSDLLANPGSFASSPAYQFAYKQGLDALQRKGNVRSGNKLAALQNYGQQSASQLYFPQAQLLSNLAISGSSPAAAGVSYQRGTERGQDYAQTAAAARAAGKPPQQPTNQTPWWMQPASTTQGTGALPYSNGQDPYAAINDYNKQTQGNVNDILSGKYDDYLKQKYGIGQSTNLGAYDPSGSGDPNFYSGQSVYSGLEEGL